MPNGMKVSRACIIRGLDAIFKGARRALHGRDAPRPAKEGLCPRGACSCRAALKTPRKGEEARGGRGSSPCRRGGVGCVWGGPPRASPPSLPPSPRIRPRGALLAHSRLPSTGWRPCCSRRPGTPEGGGGRRGSPPLLGPVAAAAASCSRRRRRHAASPSSPLLRLPRQPWRGRHLRLERPGCGRRPLGWPGAGLGAARSGLCRHGGAIAGRFPPPPLLGNEACCRKGKIGTAVD